MENIVTKNDKYQLTILIIIVVSILLVIFALIFRHVELGNRNKNTVGVVLTDGDLAINYIDGQDIHIKDDKEHTYSISITNTSSEKLFYSIYFTDINKKEEKVTIEDYDGNVLNTLEEDLDFKRLINLHEINPSETLRFVIKIEGSGFKGKLLVVNESLSSDSFADLLLTTYQVGTAKTRVGSEVSTSNEGLLSTIDNKGTTYYFRGAIDSNYVKLGNSMFRIVRINGDGSVRVVLDGLIDSKAQYNTNTNDELSTGSFASLRYASITNELQEWFNNNLGEFKKYITNSSFCTDVTFNNTQNGINYPNSYDRIFVDNTPDLYCSGDLYVGVIGLLSADEVTLAGAYRGVPNDKFYLYNEKIKDSYATVSSYSLKDNELMMINVMSNGAFGDGINVSNEVGIRPVISIGANAKIKGTGTFENPYVIVA